MVRPRADRRDGPHPLDANWTVFPEPIMAKGTVKITEKREVATGILDG
jgi:hypothetical protein